MPDITFDFSQGWGSDFDDYAAPNGAYLLGDNLVQDIPGVVKLRPGTRRLGSQMAGAVYTLVSADIAKVRQRLAVAGDGIYVNDNLVKGSVPGTGEAAARAFMSQIFVARSTKRYRWDGTTIRQWGIEVPQVATLAGSRIGQLVVSSFDSTESPAWALTEGSKTAANGSDGTANGSIEITPKAAAYRSTAVRTFAAFQQFSQVGAFPQDPADVFNIDVWVADPANAKQFTIVFGLGTGLGTEKDPFLKDRYEYVFNVNGVPLDQVPGIDTLTDKFGEYDLTPAKKQEADARRQVKNPKNPPAGAVKSDGSTGDDGWFNIAVPRSAFSRIGSTSGRDWRTVKAIKLVWQSTKGTGHIRYDNFVLIGGAKTFTGTYRVKLVKLRDAVGSWVEQSPPSLQSDPVVLSSDNMSVTVPKADFANAADPETGFDRYGVYAQGGALDRYYKAGECPLAPGNGMRIDEFSKPFFIDGKIDKSERYRFTSVGFTNPQLPVKLDPSGNLVVSILSDQADMLIRQETLTNGIRPPVDALGAVDYLGRMFVLTSTLLYYTPTYMPSIFLDFNALTVGDGTEVPYWIAKTRGGLYVGTSKDIMRVAGSGQIAPDGTIDFFLERVNVGNPPTGSGVAVYGNTVFYQAQDVWRVFDGSNSTPLDMGNNKRLWNNQVRHDIQPVSTLGRHRAAVMDGFLYVILPEGTFTGGLDYESRKFGMRVDEFKLKAYVDSDKYSRTRFTSVGFTVPSGGASNTCWRNTLGSARWERLLYPAALTSIIVEKDGTLLAGGANGYLYSLHHPDRGDHIYSQADSPALDSPIQVTYKTASAMPTQLGRNQVNEIQAFMDAGPLPSTYVDGGLYLDGILTDAFTPTIRAGAAAITIARPRFFRRQIPNRSFRSLQIRISATFNNLVLRYLVANYTPRQATRVRFDSGYFTAQNRSQMWLREIRLFMRGGPVNLQYEVYLDDTLITVPGVSVPVTDSKFSVVTLPLDRQVSKGYYVRTIVQTAIVGGLPGSSIDSDAYEVLSFEYAYTLTGKDEELKRQQVPPQ